MKVDGASLLFFAGLLSLIGGLGKSSCSSLWRKGCRPPGSGPTAS